MSEVYMELCRGTAYLSESFDLLIKQILVDHLVEASGKSETEIEAHVVEHLIERLTKLRSTIQF